MLPSSTWAGDDDDDALSAELPEDAAPYDADDMVAHRADDALRDERVQARTHDARALLDAAPGGHGSGRARRCACSATRKWPTVSDESVRTEPRTSFWPPPPACS